MAKSICFCASQRHKPELENFIAELRHLAGAIGTHIEIFEPEFEDRPQEFLNQPEEKRLEDPSYQASVAGAVFTHLTKKLPFADCCFIFNKDGYIGFNTAGELFTAFSLRKLVFALDERMLREGKNEEPAARLLVHAVVKTPDELLRRLL